MAPRCICGAFTAAPLLNPSVFRPRAALLTRNVLKHRDYSSAPTASPSSREAAHAQSSSTESAAINDLPESRLNPAPDDYASPKFADKAELTLYAGRGGNGCVSFLREAFLPDGPPNGGDGGAGGNIYIQAAYGETTLHKLARRRFLRAGRGIHGQGSAKGGTKGEDVIITVPVGTIVRELDRQDPAAEEEIALKVFDAVEKQQRKEANLAEEARRREAKQKALLAQNNEEDLEQEEEEEEEEVFTEGSGSRRSRTIEVEEEEEPEEPDPRRHKWLLYPGMSKTDMRNAEFPKLPRRTRLYHQPPAPVYLDLSRPSEQPILLATGGVGGLGNPHFTSRAHPRPVFATKGDEAVTIKIELELKLLADVGLVGLPNAGKSTLLRALTNSRTRVGNWAFTTLQPNIGTVVLDKYSGRPAVSASNRRNPDGSEDLERRTRFTVADIPGLIEGAHLDRGLGIAFLRHVERAGSLAFVIDLGAGSAVKALDALWTEVGLYAQMREEEEHDRGVESNIDWSLDPSGSSSSQGAGRLLNANALMFNQVSASSNIAGKPWFVVATKADLPDTQENFTELKAYLEKITKGEVPHPSGIKDAWIQNCSAVPVSAINGQGVDRIVHWTVGLLDG